MIQSHIPMKTQMLTVTSSNTKPATKIQPSPHDAEVDEFDDAEVDECEREVVNSGHDGSAQRARGNKKA